MRRLPRDDVLAGRGMAEATGRRLPCGKLTIASVYLDVVLADHEVNRKLWPQSRRL